jgi:hypothetical protein
LDGGSALRKAATYTEQHRHRINANTDIHALSGIRTHDPSVRADEDVIGTSNYRMITLKMCGRKRPWPNLNFYQEDACRTEE